MPVVTNARIAKGDDSGGDGPGADLVVPLVGPATGRLSTAWTGLPSRLTAPRSRRTGSATANELAAEGLGVVTRRAAAARSTLTVR